VEGSKPFTILRIAIFARRNQGNDGFSIVLQRGVMQARPSEPVSRLFVQFCVSEAFAPKPCRLA
jgi:hypothetical protein